MTDALMDTYARMPVAFTSGHGAHLQDSTGKDYLDALSGIAVCGLGHAHPGVAKAISDQANRLLHVSNLYQIPGQERLAQRLCARSGMDRAFFGNSGAEANEAAIKLARLHGHNRGFKRPAIVVTEGAFHGRTMATLTATGNRKVQAGFEPLLDGFIRVPFNDLDALRQVAANSSDVVAVLVEPIQGEAGVLVPDPDYLPGLRSICDDAGWLLMLDEVQTGNGRTGAYFAYQHAGILPDVVTTAKGLGNGVPIGACLARGTAAAVLGQGKHGSTFGGNPLACAAANAVLDALEDDQLLRRADTLGQHIREGLAEALAGSNSVREIRGMGLMIGIELANEQPDLANRALAAGLLLNMARPDVVRLLPPLVLTDADADQLVATLASLIRS